MYNIDRWENYTRQRLGMNRKQLTISSIAWPKSTPNQIRRMKKKARSRKDTSLGGFIDA